MRYVRHNKKTQQDMHKELNMKTRYSNTNEKRGGPLPPEEVDSYSLLFTIAKGIILLGILLAVFFEFKVTPESNLSDSGNVLFFLNCAFVIFSLHTARALNKKNKK